MCARVGGLVPLLQNEWNLLHETTHLNDFVTLLGGGFILLFFILSFRCSFLIPSCASLREGHLLKHVANTTHINLLSYFFVALARPVLRSEQSFTDAAFSFFWPDVGSPSVRARSRW